MKDQIIEQLKKRWAEEIEALLEEVFDEGYETALNEHEVLKEKNEKTSEETRP